VKSPLVNDCAVIGVYDSVQATEVPRAYVTLQAGIDASEETAKELMTFVAGQVASFKQVRQIRFIDAVPKSASGKILRRVLRDQVKEEEKNATPLPAKL
jgi:acyl-coenzyme A synthetase/AMP-(fatty) acid ligase